MKTVCIKSKIRMATHEKNVVLLRWRRATASTTCSPMPGGIGGVHWPGLMSLKCLDKTTWSNHTPMCCNLFGISCIICTRKVQHIWIYVHLHCLNSGTYNCWVEVAAQLQAVCKPNNRRARPTCRKGAKAKDSKESESPESREIEVWEVSDGEDTPSWGPNRESYHMPLSYHVWELFN